MTQTRTATQVSIGAAGRALILDDHSYTAVQTCRQLAKRGYVVEVLAQPSAPVFSSRYCDRKHAYDPYDPAWPRVLKNLSTERAWDVVYLCSEHLLGSITQHLERFGPWKGLVLSDPSVLRIVLSKNSVMQLVEEAGIPVPRTVYPAGEEDLNALGSEIGFPLLVKGEGGESSRTIRIVRRRNELLESYRAVTNGKEKHLHPPNLQQFIEGPTYSVGGLFQNGRAVRLCAGRMALMEPYKAGLMVRGVTERPPKLIESALRVFEALRFTGFGDADFMFDPRDSQFKFLEINPEVWANIALAGPAGVDFHGAYRALAQSEPIAEDLTFREGVTFYRVTKRLLSTLKRPWLGFGFARDFLNPSVVTDWDWTDLQPDLHLLINSARRRSRPRASYAPEKAMGRQA